MKAGSDPSPAFRIKGKVWRYPGTAGWYFVNVGKKIAASIRFVEEAGRVGWGYVRVTARLGGSRWSTTLFPTKEKDFLLAIKASVRKKEGVEAGDPVQVEITLETSGPGKKAFLPRPREVR